MAKSRGISHSGEVKAIAHIRKANACHREAEKGLTSFAEFGIQAGAALREAKLNIPHGSWGSFCDQHFDGTLRKAQFYMNLNERLNGLSKAQYIALLSSEKTLTGINRSLKKLEGKSTSQGSSGASARSGGGSAAQSQDGGAQDEPDMQPVCELAKVKELYPDGEKRDPCPNCKDERGRSFNWWTDKKKGFIGKFVCGCCSHRWGDPSDRQKMSGEAAAAPTERCPACDLVKWQKTADGYECGKCGHIYGDPAKEPSTDEKMKAFNLELERFARSITELAENIPSHAWINPTERDIITDQLKAAAGTVRSYKGKGICPKCEGARCRSCRSTGFMPRTRLEMAH